MDLKSVRRTSRFGPVPRRWVGAAVVGCAVGAGLLVWLLAGLHGRADVSTRSPAVVQAADKPAQARADTTTPIDFNRDIRPILSDRCFACHGPDAAVAVNQGGFRLDQFDTATAPASSGKHPIVPGDANASELIRRATSDKPNLVMPPPASKLTLTANEIDLLRRWIDQGAPYEGHWAYAPPSKPARPAIDNEDWARNAIDYFIAAELKRHGLSPSQEADRATLIRRLSLDLLGLPATLEQIDAFVADPSPDAYEKLVDRLLASEHFGERLAVVWLDAARYADTIGYQLDHYRSAWPYRDWVIEAFNTNKPYDRFVIEQLAGDLLPDATDQTRLATAFCRMHMMNHEGGSIDEEFRVEQVADRIETIATVFMAQTFNCAKCHDHKYDPTTQQDYYNLFSYFHSIDERGVHSNRPEQAEAYAPRMPWFSAALKAELADAQAGLQRIEQARQDAAPGIAQQQSDWESQLQQKHGVRWANAELTDAQTNQVGGTIQHKDDGSVLLSNRDSPATEDLTLTYKTDATGLRLIKLDALTDPWNNDRVGRAENGDAQPTHIRLTATSVQEPTKKQDIKLRWAWATASELGGDLDALNVLKPGKPGWGTGSAKDTDPRTLLLVADQPFGYAGGTTLEVVIEHRSGLSRRTLGRVRVDFAAANESVIEAFPVVFTGWYEAGPYKANGFDEAFDKSFGPETGSAPLAPTAAGGGQNWKHKPDYTAGKDHRLTQRESAYYLGQTIFSPVDRSIQLRLGYMNGLRAFLNGQEVYTFAASGNEQAQDKHSIDLTLALKAGENRLILKAVNTQDEPSDFNWHLVTQDEAPIALEPLALISLDRRTADGHERLSMQWQSDRSLLSVELVRARQRVKSLLDQAVPVSIMQEMDTPRPMWVLERGDYSKPLKDRPTKLELPGFIDLPMPAGAPNNRLGFAMWLVRPDHPLTARVHVNRIWQMLFGVGIVATPEDFGSQAQWPSHLDLLDDLAVDFVASGWDQKALIKQIVMSGTYRQRAVVNSAAMQVDPDNRLLSYFPRRRLPAEFVRDQALAVSGLLVETIGGPSVKPYQPDGLWREVSMGPRSNTNIFKRDAGEALYRRSLYTFIKRKAPPPQLQTFGAPNRESCVVRRDVTNTPMQALVLWNDEQFLEASRVLAQRTLTEAKTDDDRLSLIFRRCTGREPGERELGVLRKTLTYYRQRYEPSPQDAEQLLKQGEHPLPEVYDPAELASWMMLASAVLSLDETVARD